MSDRFKFRAWNKLSNEMKDVISLNINYEFPECSNVILETNTFDNIKTHNNPITCANGLNNVVLMQCTGKRDCDGNLIYENDIVRLSAKNGMKFDYLVVYKNYQYILEYINGKLKGTKARDFYKEYAQTRSLYEHGYKIIGNIYENEDLLNA